MDKIVHRTQKIWNGNGPQFFLTQRALHLELQNFNFGQADRYDNKMSQISKILNAPYGLCIHFLVWLQMTSRGFQRPNTSFLLKLKKMQLKKLPTSGCQINYYFIISILNLHFSVKFKIQSDSVGWQGRRAVHKLQKTTPTESYYFF